MAIARRPETFAAAEITFYRNGEAERPSRDDRLAIPLDGETSLRTPLQVDPPETTSDD